MATSQNGYSVPLSTASRVSTIHYYSLPGGTIGLRKGDTAVVLLYVANRFHNEVQRLLWPGVWGFAVRPIRGQTSGYSNHASGTAMDLNAPLHPRQSHSRYSGFTRTQVGKIHSILASTGGVVRWGGDYSSTPYDPMHFEINASPAQVAVLADKLRKAVAVATPSPTDFWTTPLKNSHDGYTASAGAWLVYGNEAAHAALAQSKANAVLLAKLADKLGVK